MKNLFLILFSTLSFFSFSQKRNVAIKFLFAEGEKKDTGQFKLRIKYSVLKSDTIFLPKEIFENFNGFSQYSILSVEFMKKNNKKFSSYTFSRSQWDFQSESDTSIRNFFQYPELIKDSFLQEFDLFSLANNIFPEGEFKFRLYLRLNGKEYFSKWFFIKLKKSILNKKGQDFISEEFKQKNFALVGKSLKSPNRPCCAS